ncbi:MAG: LysR family transcriptional regulator [Alteromonadaceae bacterium]|nr:LysR family transcriptional regulator [Alteromonadaceae bacterium]
MLDNVRIFVVTAESRSLTKGAIKLGMTIATVSRRLNELEKNTGCELFHRSNKGLVLTPAGKLYYDECASPIHELDYRLLNIHKSLTSPGGDLKVMAPVNIGSGPLDAFWSKFISDNPQISLTIHLDDPLADMVSYQADIAIRSGEQKNSSLIQKKIGSITPVFVVSESMFKENVWCVDDLRFLPSVAATLFSEWAIVRDGCEEFVKKEHVHVSNDMSLTLRLVKSGAGVALLPKSMVHDDLNKGELVQVFPEVEGVKRDIFLVWPYQYKLSVRAELFKDELIDFLEGQPWFDGVI